MGKGYILVEGHGDIEAAHNLVTRLWQERPGQFGWATPIRWPHVHSEDGLKRGGEFIRSKGNAEALLVLRDEDDACPKSKGPLMASWLRQAQLPFPAALVLLRPEFEVLFLPCIEQMAGQTLGEGATRRPGLRPDARWVGDWEKQRGVKEWMTDHFPPNRSYKPTTDQLPLTRLIDIPTLRAAGVPSFGTLERALDFLAAGQRAVYPPPTPESD